MDRVMQNNIVDGRMLQQQSAHFTYQGQNPQDLKHLLLCTTLELESTRIAAKDEIKRYDEVTRQLIRFLDEATRERDEAREQCQKLQEKLLQRGLSLSDPHSNVQPDSPAGRSLKGDSTITECDSMSGTYKHHSFVSSPGQSMFDTVSSIQEPSKINLPESSSMDLFQQSYFEFCEDYGRHSFPAQNLQQMQMPLGCNTGRPGSSKPQTQLELLHKNIKTSSTLSEMPHTSYVSDSLQNAESQPLMNVSSSAAERNVHSEHHPSIQSGLTVNVSNVCDVQCQPQDILNLQQYISERNKTNSLEHIINHSSPAEGESQGQVLLQKQTSEHVQSDELLVSDKRLQFKDGNLCSQFSTGKESLWKTSGSIDTLEKMPQEPFVSDCGMTNSASLSQVACLPSLQNHGISTIPLSMSSSQAITGASSSMLQFKRQGDLSSNAVPVHLPEPPEADPQVIMKSLPEKGKLLEAVMKAGPLLQTLLLAGPLPQWRHPPPPLESFEIPLVSIPNSNPINPLLKPPLLNMPVRDGTQLLPSSRPVFCPPNQSDTTQIPANALFQSAATTSSSSNKRTLPSSSINGHFVQEPRPPPKYPKLQ